MSMPDLSPPDTGKPSLRAQQCPTARSNDLLPQRQVATAAAPTMTFDDLSQTLSTSCGGCHQAPTETGGFSFQNQYKGSDAVAGGKTRFVPGLFEAAPLMVKQLQAKNMPPDNIRSNNPAYYDDLGVKLKAWIDAGEPNGTFTLPSSGGGDNGQRLPPEIAGAMTDIGDCIPNADIIGFDQDKDSAFANASALPPLLSDTDLVSLDAYALAQKGTVAFDVEYPLWADNAHKGRWVHVPASWDDPAHPQRQSITYDATNERFSIPDNTRFYKTFFKEVKQADGSLRWRKIETRLIVVRHAPREPLYGTYLWDQNEAVAKRHDGPYRNGQPFADNVFQYETDEGTHELRTYAVPAKHRCNECHQGSASDSFILGFTPLQINRRGSGAVHDSTPGADEMSQTARLVKYGVISGITADAFPRLETAGGDRAPRNDHELRMQAYVQGNCGHCHNPNGFATHQNPALRLNFWASRDGGGLFQFATSLASVYPLGGNYIVPGNPGSSVIYKRVSSPTQLEGIVPLLHMPLHTPGTDCQVLNLAAKWITSIPVNGANATPADIATALDNAAHTSAICPTPGDISWLTEDFTVESPYQPRRADWDTPNGMPQSFRDLQFDQGLQDIAKQDIPNGYWNNDPACQFPDVNKPINGDVRPWMLNPDGTPVEPFGRVFYRKPGATFFASVCQKCHGPRANGDSGIAKVILTATNGKTRVANLIDGLFFRDSMMGYPNLSLFDRLEPDGKTTRNLAGNYLIWMASGGTNAQFPPELEAIVGPNGGNMLNLVRQGCGQLLPGHPNQLLPTYQVFDTFNTVCTYLNPITADAGFVGDGTMTPKNGPVQTAWLNRAAQNAGWTIFRFFKEDASMGNWPLQPSDCVQKYPKPATTATGTTMTAASSPARQGLSGGGK